MNADCKGALAQINKSWKAFEHKGNPMSKAEVKAVLEYAVEKGYEHTGMLSDEEVDNILKTFNPTPMSTEELLRPRYKVIAPDTSGLFEVGQYLIHPIDWLDYIWQIDNARKTTIFHPENFPHLFKKLEWWEEREPEEMPEYVKWNYNPKTDNEDVKGLVEKVIKWVQDGYAVITSGNMVIATCHWSPAILAEYEQYINQQKQSNGE